MEALLGIERREVPAAGTFDQDLAYESVGRPFESGGTHHLIY
jgi:hypothetical protein